MAGEENIPYDDPTLKGIKRYLNNCTIKGRANVAIATYLGMALYYVYRKFKKTSPA